MLLSRRFFDQTILIRKITFLFCGNAFFNFRECNCFATWISNQFLISGQEFISLWLNANFVSAMSEKYPGFEEKTVFLGCESYYPKRIKHISSVFSFSLTDEDKKEDRNSFFRPEENFVASWKLRDCIYDFRLGKSNLEKCPLFTIQWH